MPTMLPETTCPVHALKALPATQQSSIQNTPFITAAKIRKKWDRCTDFRHESMRRRIADGVAGWPPLLPGTAHTDTSGAMLRDTESDVRHSDSGDFLRAVASRRSGHSAVHVAHPPPEPLRKRRQTIDRPMRRTITAAVAKPMAHTAQSCHPVAVSKTTAPADRPPMPRPTPAPYRRPRRSRPSANPPRHRWRPPWRCRVCRAG